MDPDPECDGLVPSRVPAAVTAEIAEPSGSCGPGVSEGGGHVAVVARFGRGFEELQVFSPDGKPERRFTASALLSPCVLPTTCGPVFPQQDGFLAAATSGGNSSFDPVEVEVRRYSADGTLAHAEQPTTREMGIFAASLHEDPLGGVLVTANGAVPPDLAGAGTCGGHAFRFGADGHLRARSDVGCSVVGAGVSNRGEALVLESADAEPSPSGIVLQWLKRDGTAAKPATGEKRPFASGAHLAPLLQGGLLLNDGGAWTRRYPHLGDASEPAPEWLASRAGWTFRFTRGNRAYALFPPPGQQLAECEPGLEIHAVSGRLCGTITFREQGGACRTATLDQGWDGTVVQQSARNACRWRWWPRLLAR